MKKNKGKWLCLFAILASSLFFSSAYATGDIVKIQLPKGVSVELPKDWIVLSNDKRLTIDTKVKSTLDLAGLDQGSSVQPFVANYYSNGEAIGTINIRYYVTLDLTQTDARQTTAIDVKDLDEWLKEIIFKSSNASGISILSWEGTKKSTINGLTTFITEYHRKSLTDAGSFRVRLVRVFAGDKTFTLTVSYNEKEAFFLKNITDKIISSLNMTGTN